MSPITTKVYTQIRFEQTNCNILILLAFPAVVLFISALNVLTCPNNVVWVINWCDLT